MATNKSKKSERVQEYSKDHPQLDPDVPLHGESTGQYTPGTDQGGLVPGGTSAAELGGGGVAGDIDRPDITGRGTTEDVTHPEHGGSYPRGLASPGIKTTGGTKRTKRVQKDNKDKKEF